MAAELQTTSKTAARWGVSPRWVRQLCEDGQVPGAERHEAPDGSTWWLIPEDEPRPVKKRGRRWPAKD